MPEDTLEILQARLLKLEKEVEAMQQTNKNIIADMDVIARFMERRFLMERISPISEARN